VVYWLGYFASVRDSPQWISNLEWLPVESSPDYAGFTASMQPLAYSLFSPAHFMDSHLLRPSKWLILANAASNQHLQETPR
jgi:hypothetical protein